MSIAKLETFSESMEMLDNVKAFFLSVVQFIHQRLGKSDSPALPQPAASPVDDIEAAIVLELPGHASAARNQESSKPLTTFMAFQHDLQWQNVILTFCFTSAIEVSLRQQNDQSKNSSIFISFAILFAFVLLLVIKLMDRRFTKIFQALEKVAILLATAAFFYIVAIPFPLSLKYTIWAIFAISLLIAVVHTFIYGIGKAD